MKTALLAVLACIVTMLAILYLAAAHAAPSARHNALAAAQRYYATQHVAEPACIVDAEHDRSWLACRPVTTPRYP